MGGMFSKFVYNNIRSTHEEVQIDHSGKRPVVDIHSQSDLDIQGFEDFSTVPPTEIFKKAGLITNASASQPTKKRRTVRFDSATVEEKVCQKIPSFISTRTVATQKTSSSDSECVHASKTTLSSSSKSVRQDNSDEKWNEIKLFLQSYDVKGCNEDIGTVRLDALVEFIVNQNSDNPNVGTSTTMHIHKDHMVDYTSTFFELDQGELDTILEGIAAPVDDLSIEVIPPSEVIVNQHHISDSQLSSDFSDTVIAAHQAHIDVIFYYLQKKLKLRNDQDYRNCGVFIDGYAEYLSEEMNVPSDGIEAEYYQMGYATLLQKYGIQKAKKGYVSENDDPSKSRTKIIPISDESEIVSIE
ncbi:hypothetical protein T459_14417 [Capsicum annuum]|uniref:Uncharacterized protein n=1 Tax=Capsicum annuum TaxID=4072 RepID=A0A2G2ZHD0_CAPAN|nr:hypothetical protein T459_14417 [Capsicum annuum]